MVLAALVAAALIVVGGGIYLLRDPLGLSSRTATPIAQPAGQPTPRPQPPAAPPSSPVPQPVAEIFEKWRVQCVQDAQSRQLCRAEQLIVGKDGVPQLAIYASPPLAGRVAQAMIVPPWGLLVERGLTMQVDARPRFTAPIVSCQATGCWSEFSLDDALLGQMRQGTALQVTMIAANGEPVVVVVPLAGFAAAYDRLLQKNGR